ncbi:phnA protein [Sansalvadorimonas sp. 2012CJ34-2]|uniref:PhnA protein n=1 Tax=Parendozoicomonas callyspongiae TaxID=2942213 RepID=A0ABT0PCP6_9GAMM|nr:phnA protein [Sansalvadorimonas sp. 2012CJ34-2]MCL6269162.1 phnA protein [Sansalvadorimonas sp. 2012CJ34-2]
MAKGLIKHQERQQALSLLGKDLTRRASSKCELCEAAGVRLVTFEVPPEPKEPNIDHCLLICEECKTHLADRKHRQPDHWRCLTKTIWSELPVAKVIALRTLRELAASHSWASDALENAWLEPEVEEWAALN